ncbi:hypothetical protein L1987_43163 [Smallanthus sonchifolius]|uniref:Uncharacterized protein n=1 Tax=Smallanthus sonchifolius TaxID=185202 RepID=A0ACB9GLK0_9ASTR|nr:hypothetical protein L1987_43163 [Smallanthus sonchifolius]
MGLWVTLQREARSGKFEYFKPQVPKRVKDKHAVHPVTKKHIKKLVYKPVRCETKIPLSKLPQDILGDMWYWYVDPKTGEAVVMGKGKSASGNMVPKEVIRIFDEVCFINFSVNDLEVLADKYCIHTDEWTKLLSAKYDKLIKFCLDYKKKMEPKDPVLDLHDDSSSDGESLPSADEEHDQVQNVEFDIASGVSEDDTVLTQNSSDGADYENIPIAKVFMADMSDPSKRNEIVAQKNKENSYKESEVIKLHRKLENFENSSVVLDYFNANADPTKRVAGIGFVPPPFNANYVVEPEIIHEEEIDPNTVLKVNPVTGEDMIYDSDSENEVFDDKKVEGIPKEVKLDEPKVVKNVTRDRCILTEVDEVKVDQTKLSKMLQSSGFVAAGHQKKNSSTVTKQVFVQKKPVNYSVKSSEACSSKGLSNSRKTPYIRNHQDRRVCFHCNKAGHILIQCPYKNQGKLKSVSSQQCVVTILKRPNVGKPTSSVVKNVPCQSFAKYLGFKQHDKHISKTVVFQNKFEIPHVGIPKDSQTEVKLSRPQRRRLNRKLKKLLEISESDNHKSNNVFPINHTVSSLRRSNCESYVPKVDDNVDCELLEGQPRRTINNTWYVDSGCSRHLTANIRLLEDVINIDGGFVAFAGNKGGYITGQGTLKNDKVKFEKVNYVEQLEHNLLSVSQVCDKKFSFHFNDYECYILKSGFVIPDEWILMKAPRRNGTYVLDMSVATTTDSIPTCLLSKASESDSILWHRKLAHINYRKMNYLVKNDLVIGVLKMKFFVPDDCIPCKKGKQHKKSHKSKTKNSIVTPLELLHNDLFGQISIRSIGENLCKQKVRRIRSDNGGEFKNSKMGLFCLQKGIHHEFSAPYVPQQNGVAERKNKTFVETTHTMLADSKLPVTFWAEAVNTACHPNLEYLLPFGNPCTLLKVRDVSTKFSAKAIEGIFLGYVANSPTKRVYNKETRQDAQNSGFLPTAVPQSYVPSTSAPDPNVASCSGTQESDSEDDNGEIPTNLDSEIPVNHDMSYQSDTTQVDVLPVPEVASIKELKAHPITNIIRNLRYGVQTRSIIENTCLYTCIKDTGVLDIPSKNKRASFDCSKENLSLSERKTKIETMFPHGSNFEFNAYTDSDFGGCCLDRKSTTGGCKFLGNRLVSWQCKKQTTVSISTCEAEYIVAVSWCSLILWTQHQLRDYGLNFTGTPMFIDNNARMSITNNPVKHSKTKHIEIRYHFIRDCVDKKLIELVKVHTYDNFADLFTKAFDRTRFEFLIKMIDNSWILLPESIDSHYKANSLESFDSESS